MRQGKRLLIFRIYLTVHRRAQSTRNAATLSCAGSQQTGEIRATQPPTSLLSPHVYRWLLSPHVSSWLWSNCYPFPNQLSTKQPVCGAMDDLLRCQGDLQLIAK